MKFKSYIALLLGVLVLSMPFTAVGQSGKMHNDIQKECCANKLKQEDTNKGQEKESKNCCGSSSCECPISMVSVAFVLPTFHTEPDEEVFYENNVSEFYLNKETSSSLSSIWQPPKF